MIFSPCTVFNKDSARGYVEHWIRPAVWAGCWLVPDYSRTAPRLHQDQNAAIQAFPSQLSRNRQINIHPTRAIRLLQRGLKSLLWVRFHYCPRIRHLLEVQGQADGIPECKPSGPRRCLVSVGNRTVRVYCWTISQLRILPNRVFQDHSAD